MPLKILVTTGCVLVSLYAWLVVYLLALLLSKLFTTGAMLNVYIRRRYTIHLIFMHELNIHDF